MISLLELKEYFMKENNFEETPPEQPIDVLHVPGQIMRDLQNVQKCSDVQQIEVMTRRIFDYIDNDKNGLIEGKEITDFIKI